MFTSSTGRILLPAAAGLALIASATTSHADHGVLDGKQIRELMVGHTSTGVSSRSGRRWYGDYAPDGTYAVRVPDTGWSTNGTWRIDGDLWCTDRPQRSERCKRIEHLSGDEYHAIDDRGETVPFSIER